MNPEAPASPPAPLEPSSLPQAGHSGPAFEAPPMTPAESQRLRRPMPVRHPLLPSGAAYFVRSVAAILAMLAMVAIGAWMLIYSRHMRGPQFLGPRLAARYLDALASNDYVTAYGMLSETARSICTQDEFRLSRDRTPWTWSNIEIAAVEPGAVVMRYDLSVEGRPPVKDTIVFVREGKRWVRPYNWPALKKAEAAFDANSPDLAMIAAQEAMHLDPRDPMARGYICEASYYLKMTDRIEADCRTAIDLAARYPSKLTAKSLYHLHAILADTYKNVLKNYDSAISEYNAMLEFPRISPEDQCELLLARSDANVLAGRRPAAVEDLGAARRVCTKSEDLQHIARRSAELSTR